MQAITAKKVLVFVLALLFLSVIYGAGPVSRGGFLHAYPPALTEADQALKDARAAGKDKECPADFDALKAMVDKAYEVYWSCRTNEAIAMAKEATEKIKALCGKPRAEAPRPAPTPPPPPPPPPAEPQAKVTVLKLEPLEDVFFDNGKSTIKPEAGTILDTDAKLIIEEVKKNPKFLVRIIGYCSSPGSKALNDSLSLARANAVRTELINRGAPANALQAIGRGASNFRVYPDRTEEEQRKNRRVEFETQ